MGRVNQLWQDEQEARWQQHYDDYCFNELGGREPIGSEVSAAEEYACDMMEDENGEPIKRRAA